MSDQPATYDQLTPYQRLMLLAKLLEKFDEDIEIVIEEIYAGQRSAEDLAKLMNQLINIPLKIQERIARKIIRMELGRL